MAPRRTGAGRAGACPHRLLRRRRHQELTARPRTTPHQLTDGPTRTTAAHHTPRRREETGGRC
ncbi:hypothetical protein SCOCK_40237 [Actinacidiphila cocklensis]|uniref:Uncharacterized protein n=1 Tax=Actinacidiphila cocklensis TaxID=887465 RepID=A0A9W4DZG6_9ACTN|nr:hypothetical protein SCOCK_40237 [Actinacidiphila cocklensis]